MKFTLAWLKQHLDTEARLDVIVDKLTMIGLEGDDSFGVPSPLAGEGQGRG